MLNGIDASLLQELRALTFQPPGVMSGSESKVVVEEDIEKKHGTTTVSRAHGSSVMSDYNHQVPQNYTETEEDDDAFDPQCETGRYAEAWSHVKTHLRLSYSSDRAFGYTGKHVLEGILHNAVHLLAEYEVPVKLEDEACGIGRLLMQIIAISAANDNPEAVLSIFKNEQISSPVLTLLLDVPWLAIKPWPFFGILGQIAALRLEWVPNSAEVDGFVSDEIVKFAEMYSHALAQKDWEGVVELSRVFLSNSEETTKLSPMGYLTMVFTQAAALNLSGEDNSEVLLGAQYLVKQLVRNPEELEAMLSTRWPLWSMLHIATIYRPRMPSVVEQ